MEKKKTQKELYAELRVLAQGNDELIAFIDKKVEQLNHRTDTKKITAKQVANAEIKDRLYDWLAEQDKGMTCTEIYTLTDFGITSATHASALLKQMVDSGRVAKTYDKKVAKFQVALDSGEGE